MLFFTFLFSFFRPAAATSRPQAEFRRKSTFARLAAAASRKKKIDTKSDIMTKKTPNLPEFGRGLVARGSLGAKPFRRHAPSQGL